MDCISSSCQKGSVQTLVRIILGYALLLTADVGSSAAPTNSIYNTRTNLPALTPEQSLNSIQLPPGFHASLFAAEPDVQQPIGMTMDRRGRLWVCENYTYSERPLSWDTNLNDRILILEDTNNDGKFDKRTVFWDKARKLTSVAVAFGGVFVLCPPQLLFIPDKDGNDVPDSEPEVLLDGFEDTVIWHNIANGLKFGPDGWIYGRQGIQGTSHIGRPGTPPESRTPINAGIWRFHPVTRRFEVVAEGTTNPWGTDWDDDGQLFFINTVIGHLWHVIPGAYYRRMYGEPLRSHLYELIEQTADHYHWDTRDTWDRIRETGVTPTTSEAGGGHAHSGLMVYLGDNWPNQYRNTVFAVNFHGKRLNNDLIEREGASYTAHHGKDLMMVGDPWFRGIDLLYGPDGGVYVSDWSDTGECHNADGINRTSGRIYKIAYGNVVNPGPLNIEKLKDDELVRLQLHRNDWWVRQARLTLQERAATGRDMTEVRSTLKRMFDEQTDIGRKLRCLWALYVTGGAEEEGLRSLLGHRNEQLRVWAIQLLVDKGELADGVLSDLATMARVDKSGLVLSFITSALRRVPFEKRWPIAMELAARGEFSQDRVLPLLIWYGIEPAVPHSTQQAISLAGQTRMPKLRRFVARRIFEDLASTPAPADQVVQLLMRSSDARFHADLLAGISEALKDIKKPVAPPSWAKVSPALDQSVDPIIRQYWQELSALFGDPRALEQLRSIIADKSADMGNRRKALQILLQSRAERLTPLLVPLLDEAELAPDAVRALAAVGETNTAGILLERYPKMEGRTIKSEIINALATRLISALALLDAIQQGIIPRDAVGLTQIRQLKSLNNAQIDAKVIAIWPQLDESPSGKREVFAKYKALLTPERLQAAAPSEGRHLFQLTCGLCHSLFGEGAKIGPDLTGADRKNMDYLLDNLLDPSGIVAENYRAWVVDLKDDRVLNGIILSRTADTVTLQTISEKMVLQKSDIQSMSQSKLSMMPEGLLQAMSDQQACDLLRYLMSPRQVPLPPAK